MWLERKSPFLVVLTLISLLDAKVALAGGYELPIFWSGRYAGAAASAVGTVTGAESLFFNPAGLGSAPGLQLLLNVTGVYGQSSAPILPNAPVSFSAAGPLGSLFVSYEIIPKLSAGIGAYVSGGGGGTFPETNYADLGATSANFSNLKIASSGAIRFAEASLGLGYEILDGLRIGAAYRVMVVTGDITGGAIETASGIRFLTKYNFAGLNGFSYNGLRAGIQYAPKNSIWGLGAQWRNEVEFNASATASGAIISESAALSPTAATLTAGAVNLQNVFPQRVTLGGFIDPISTLRVSLQYDWTETGRNQAMTITGAKFTGTWGTDGLLGQSSTTKNISTDQKSSAQNWVNESTLRLGLEFTGLPKWAFRGGYSYTSQYIPDNATNAFTGPPGPTHTATLGAGVNLTKAFDLDMAAAYSMASGTGTGGLGTSSGTTNPAGAYSFGAAALHLGVTCKL